MKIVAALGLLTATTAYAQAPGETLPEVPAQPATDSIPVMANRWAVGLSAGSLSIAPKDAPDDKTQFGIGELSLRFRATYHLDVDLAVGGGREQLDDGSQGDLQVQTVLASLRYRFAADRPWNWWVGAGFGAHAVTRYDATHEEQDDAERPLAALSIGVEHRWRHFALQAELHGFAVGERQDQQADAPPKAMPVANTMQPPPDVSVAPSQERSGGILTIGASYYF
jgi:hypothetical protein